MQVLIIGNGGREHALAWKIAQSDQIECVYVAKGNAGTEQESKCQNIDIEPTDIPALFAFAKTHHIDLTLVGPEAPLANGIVDLFREHQLRIIGPTQAAAQLESSKTFCKQFLQRHNIPTAAWASFTELSPALAYLDKQNFPVVIKADGLAAGKGVVIAQDKATAQQTLTDMLSHQAFGSASHRVVIETFLCGEELSFICLVDGEHILPLASSQDHKRLLNGDRGPNTGGMGAYSPAPLCTPKLEQQILNEIILPTVHGMQAQGMPYTGFLYAGLMIDDKGQPHVLEFNCRLGDPETQPLMMRLQSDLLELCLHCCDTTLNQITPSWDSRYAITVVMAAGGYPGQYEKGHSITGLENVPASCKVFHAGTARSQNNIITAGGRVLGATGLATNLRQAKQLVHQTISQISWPNCHYRSDIGHRSKQT